MRELRKWVWTVVVAAAGTTPVVAQMGGGGGTGGAGSISNAFSGSSGTAGASGVGGSSSGGGGSGLGGGGSGSSGSSLQGSALQTMTAAPKLTAPTGTANNSLSASNPFAGYYANPYYQGIITAQTNATPGGFGAALYGNSTSGSGTGSVNRGTNGGIGGQNSNQQSGILIPLPVQINYSAVMAFPTTPMATTQMQADLRGLIDRTTQIANPKGVQIITDNNNNVVLRGTVKNDEEFRLVEGLVRLTPGVGAIKNELSAAPTVATTANPTVTAGLGR